MGDAVSIQKRHGVGVAFVAHLLLAQREAMLAPALFDDDNGSTALLLSDAQRFVPSAKEAEYHGIIGLIGRQFRYLTAADIYILDFFFIAICGQNRQCLRAYIYRRYLSAVGGQLQAEVPQPTARITHMGVFGQSLGKVFRQQMVVVAVFAGIPQKADHIFIPNKHQSSSFSSGTINRPSSASARRVLML